MIAADAGVHRGTVFNHLVILESAGKLTRDSRKGRVANQYRVAVPADYDPRNDKWDSETRVWTSVNGSTNRRDVVTVNRRDGPTVADSQPLRFRVPTVVIQGSNRRDGATQPLRTSKEPLSTSGTGGEIEAGLTMAAQRRVEEKILSGATIRNPAGYQRTTKENLREEWAEVIEHAQREGWSRNELADKIAPAPHVERVPRGASKDPGVMFCDDYNGRDNGHHCYLTECPPESGHRFVKSRLQDHDGGYQTYGGQTFYGYRLWDPERDGDEIEVSLVSKAADLSALA